MVRGSCTSYGVSDRFTLGRPASVLPLMAQVTDVARCGTGNLYSHLGGDWHFGDPEVPLHLPTLGGRGAQFNPPILADPRTTASLARIVPEGWN